MSRRAVYTGSFDPISLGHLNVIERSSRLVDELIVGVGQNIDKQELFTGEERVELIREVTAHLSNVKVKLFSGLAVRFVREEGARVIVRGIRSLTDMESEFTMTLANRKLDPQLAGELPWDAMPEALERLRNRNVSGKLALTIGR